VLGFVQVGVFVLECSYWVFKLGCSSLCVQVGVFRWVRFCEFLVSIFRWRKPPHPPNVDRLDVAGGLNPGLSEPGN
jgi:hypothetical protein